MRIISYQKLLQMSPVMTYKRRATNLITPDIELSEWEDELVVIIGSQLACQAFLGKALQLPAGSCGAAQVLQPRLSLYTLIYQTIDQEYSQLSHSRKTALTEQYLAATHLQHYRAWRAEEVPAIIWKKLLLTLTFALNQKIMLLPDVFTGARQAEKIILQRTIRHLQAVGPKGRIMVFQTQQPEEALLLANRIVVLKPTAAGAVGAVIPVFFQGNRNLQQLPGYKTLRRRLLYLLTDAFAGEDLISFSPLASLS